MWLSLWQCMQSTWVTMSSSSIVCKGITHLWEDVVCPKSKFEEWHKHKCLFGNYPMCGVQIFFLLSQRTYRITFWRNPMASLCFGNHNVQEWPIVEEAHIGVQDHNIRWVHWLLRNDQQWRWLTSILF